MQLTRYIVEQFGFLIHRVRERCEVIVLQMIVLIYTFASERY